MKKYTGSYGNTEGNFVFLNRNLEGERIKNHTLYGLFCVVQNIIQRGKVSTPSEYLQQKLGNLGNIEEPYLLIAEDYAKWNLIKGDKKSVDYPAQSFFEKLLPRYLGEYSFVKNLIIPEAEFSDILGYSTVLDGQQVDFYIPQIKTVIEIDGNSHLKSGQIYKDSTRDKALEKENICVVRIATSDIRGETNKFKKIMTTLRKKIAMDERIKKYKDIGSIEVNNIRLKYDAVYRVQILLLECMKTGILNLGENPINVNISNSDIPHLEKLVAYAYEDLKLWIDNISELLKIKMTLPELLFNCGEIENSVYVDFSMFARYTDTTVENESVIYVRNDYFCNGYFYRVASADTLQYSFAVETEKEDNEALVFLLKNIFGFEEYNAGQLPIIKNTLERNDTIGILPTGGGKSLTYQICSLLQPGVTMVVVPIISLMEDQKRGMDQRHLDRTNFLSSGQNGDEKSKIIDDFIEGKYQLIWISPERFQNCEFREALVKINEKMNFALAVIDEVHCLSEWGHDFRVSYLALVDTLRNYCPEACLLGLTATASQAVLEDLKAEFENDGSGVKALTSMDREELLFERIVVKSEEERNEKIIDIVKKNNIDYKNLDGGVKHQIGLIFCPTVYGKRASCAIVQQKLADSKVIERIKAYHGKLTMAERTKVQSEFMEDKYDVMVCTKAFGMGIDKENIKYTVHCSLPQSVESFYQEAGRAGREMDKSVKSHCYVLYYPESENLHNVVEKIFRADTDVNERKRLSDDFKNDLSTIMYFWNYNRKTPEEEYNNISKVLRKLYSGKTVIKFDSSVLLGDIQGALYKLSLLGIVDNWTIEYVSLEQGRVDVEYIGLNEENISKSLLAYIHKYDMEFRIDIDSTRYHKYFAMLHKNEDKIITRYIRILIEWANDNILYNRLQSTYTMLQWMSPNISDTQFRNNLVEYFRFSEKSVVYEGIIYNPLDYNNWFELLYSKDNRTNKKNAPINEEMAEVNLAALQRYLESYRNNTGLNFLSGIFRIMTGKYAGTEGEWRFREALQNIKESLNESEQRNIINMTLDVGKAMNNDCKDQLSKEILNCYDGLEEFVFNKIRDRYTLSVLLDDPVKRIETIVKENF